MADFEPAARTARAYVTREGTRPGALTVPPEVLRLVAEHQHRSASAGTPWQRLLLKREADGVATFQTDPVAVRPSAPGRTQWALTILTATCIVVAAVLFIVDWRWSALPAADVAQLPPMTQREQSALNVVSRFYDAKNRADPAGMREVACANPGGALANDILSVEQNNLQEVTFVDAIVDFSDQGSRASASVVLRFRGVSDRMKQLVAERQLGDVGGGLFFARFTLVDDGSGLKVCDR